MDMSLINVAVTALNTACDLGKAAIGLRDFNKMSATVAQINSQLATAYESLFAHQRELSAIHDENRVLKELLLQRDLLLLEAKNEIAELKQKKLEFDQYERFLYPNSGAWAVKRKDETAEGTDAPTYCGPCFENEQLSLLYPGTGQERTYLVCRRCSFKMRR